MSDHSITTQPATGSALPIRWWQAVLLLCLFVSATGLGIYWGQTHIVAGIENGFLEVAPEHLDFGEVWVQDKFQWTLPITNTSSEPVEVLEFRASCNCASIEPPSLLLAPGETVDVHLTLDLTTRNPEEAAKESRPFSVRIAPLINSGLAQYTGWEIQGQVRRPLLLDPPALDFPEGSLVRNEGFACRSVRVDSALPLKELRARCDETMARIEVEQLSDGPSQFSVTICPSTTLPIGRTEFSVMLEGVTKQGNILPAISLPVSVQVIADVYTVPEIVALGGIRVGEEITETVVLHSRRNRSFRIAEVRTDQKDVRVEKSDREQTFRVVVRAFRPGPGSAVIHFAIQMSDDEEEFDIPLKVQWHAADGAKSSPVVRASKGD